ncbi:MAG TPA: glycoside hydrolase family 15 protein [Solirubrobacterales bacterium]|nr:glycoside hydrolase family 15 protein [Solirubrobacterales bacterium]
MAWSRAALALVAAGTVALVAVSGGSSADPHTPAGLPGLPPPFLGTAVVGSGGLTAAIDSYGDVVDLRAPGPAGRPMIDNPADRQAAGSVATDTGIVPRVSINDGAALPLWRADSVAQRYLPGTNLVRTVAQFGRARVAVTDAAVGEELARLVEVRAPTGARAVLTSGINLEAGVHCENKANQGGPAGHQGRRHWRLAIVCSTTLQGSSANGPRGTRTDVSANGRAASAEAVVRRIFRAATARDRRWIARARPLGSEAPGWARRMYRRSLLTLRALTDRLSGAVAAGVRDGWAYVWPRDAGAVALALAASGYRPEARRIARFLLGLDLGAAARFHGDGAPVAGREAQGDASGWAAVAAQAAGLPAAAASLSWRDSPDYRESDPGDYLANAIAAAGAPADGPNSGAYAAASAQRSEVADVAGGFGIPRGLARQARDPGSGLDSAAAWAVRPFPLPALFPAVRRTLLSLAADRTRFGITPGEGWPGADPWTAPTAWTAWSLAALSDRERRGGPASCSAAHRDRRAALRLLADLRRASTPAGALPERVGARTGVPRSTTPLAWSHAFTILALRQLWP